MNHGIGGARIVNLASLFFLGVLLMVISGFGMSRLAEFRDEGSRRAVGALSGAFATSGDADEIYLRQFSGDL